jgi:hypothetical protein
VPARERHGRRLQLAHRVAYRLADVRDPDQGDGEIEQPRTVRVLNEQPMVAQRVEDLGEDAARQIDLRQRRARRRAPGRSRR